MRFPSFSLEPLNPESCINNLTGTTKEKEIEIKAKSCIFCVVGILLLCLSVYAEPSGGNKRESQIVLYSWLAG